MGADRKVVNVYTYQLGHMRYIFELDHEEHCLPPSFFTPMYQSCFFPVKGSLATINAMAPLKYKITPSCMDLWFPKEDCVVASKWELDEYEKADLI